MCLRLVLKKSKETKSFVVCVVRLLRLNCGLCPVVFSESDETNKDIEDHLSMGVLNSGSVDIVCQHQAGQFSGFPTCVATVKANIIKRGPTVYLKNDYT